MSYNETDEYVAIMRRETTRYETLPWWRVFARTRQMGRLRTAAADVAYAGREVRMPETSRSKIPDLAIDAIFSIPAIICCFVVIIVAIVWACIAFSGPPKPLAPGIIQRGFTFIIPSGYIQRANYSDADPGSLCDRIPTYGQHDHYAMSPQKDGTIKIVCDPNSSS